VAAALPQGTTLTPFALTGASYGTRVQGGDLPASSGRTAFSWIGCTKLAGKSRANHLVRAELDGSGFAEGVGTRTWTTRTVTKNGPVVNSFSRTNIERAKLGPLGLRGIALTTRAWHDSNGFHASRTASIARLGFEGSPLDIPTTPGQVIDLPGFGKLIFLSGRRRVSADGAWVTATAVRVQLEGSSSVATLGSAFSEINNENPAGVMAGFGQAARVSTLDSAVTSGKIAVQPLPCRGTEGEWKNNDTVGVDLGGQLVLGAASGGARGNQRSRLNGYGMTRGRVTELTLGELPDQVKLTAIQGQATVALVDGELKRSIKGTTLGSFTIGGVPQSLPGRGETVPIPGGELTFAKRVNQRARNAVHVIAVRIRLFTDSPGDTVIDLGEAKAVYKRF
jgi:hypothetical protein